MPKIYIILICLFLFIILFFKFYCYKYLFSFFNRIKYKNNPHLHQILESGIPQDFIKEISNYNSREYILKCLENYLSNIETPDMIIKNIKISSKKNIIIFLGENGSGKTTALFQIYKYFSQYTNVIVSTIDLYKRAFSTFYELIYQYNADYISFEKTLSVKESYKYILNKFINSEMSLLLLDTSGKNLLNNNLKNETIFFIDKIKSICKDKDINYFFIYVLNTLNNFNNRDSEIIKHSNAVILSHFNFKNFYIIELLKKMHIKTLIFGYILDNILYFFNKKKFFSYFTDEIIKLVH